MPDFDAAQSGVLCAWVGAWLAGNASADDVLRVANSSAGHHALQFIDPVEPEPGPTVGIASPQYDGAADPELASFFTDHPANASRSFVDVLGYWRRSQAHVWAAFPTAGDVRGLGSSRALRDAALRAGQAVCGAQLGVVPVWRSSPARSSAPDMLLWQVFRIDPAQPDSASLADAAYELTESIRLSASALARAQVGRRTPAMQAELSRLREQPIDLDLPPGFPPRAVALLAQAERMATVLDIAAADPTGSAIDRDSAALREDVLRGLTTAIRRARVAGYNALTERVSR